MPIYIPRESLVDESYSHQNTTIDCVCCGALRDRLTNHGFLGGSFGGNPTSNPLIDLRIELPESSDLLADIAKIVSQSRRLAYAAVDVVLFLRNWLIGKRIAEEELKDSEKENDGLEIIETLSKELSKESEKGFDQVNLYYDLRFFKAYPNIFYTASKQSSASWSHYRLLLAIDDLEARQWYESEAIRYALA